MGARYYLGVDGGGTNTRVRLADAAGTVLGEGRAGSSNLSLGVDLARDAILAATREALAACELGEETLQSTIAGCGLAAANVPEFAEAFLALALPFRATCLVSDAVTACLGAHGGGDGAILILGTGSQGLVMKAGKIRTVGGWGFEISDDGAGSILGQAAIRAAIRAYDDLAPTSAFTEAILSRFSHDPAQAMVWAKAARPADFGTFAPLVIAHADEGDPVARGLLAERARDVDRILERLIALGAERITLVGGLAATTGPQVRADLQRFLVPAQSDAMAGGLALARQQDPDRSDPVLI